MEKKKPIIILFILLLIALTVVLVEKKFAEPYSTIEKLINDAKENKNIGTYLIEQDEEWIPLKEQSKYGLIRKELGSHPLNTPLYQKGLLQNYLQILYPYPLLCQ